MREQGVPEESIRKEVQSWRDDQGWEPDTPFTSAMIEAFLTKHAGFPELALQEVHEWSEALGPDVVAQAFRMIQSAVQDLEAKRIEEAAERAKRAAAERRGHR